jgi:hypothetical protein
VAPRKGMTLDWEFEIVNENGIEKKWFRGRISKVKEDVVWTKFKGEKDLHESALKEFLTYQRNGTLVLHKA